MEKIQRKATKMTPELSNLSYERRLQRLELISLEQRRLRGQLIEAFKYLNGLNNVTLEELYRRDGNVRTRNDGHRLKLRNFKTSQAMNFFPVKIAATWNQLPENMVSASTVNTFKNRLDKYWITISQYYNVLTLYLNIIEHLWSVLEIQVRHRFPPPSSLKELEGILTEEWLAIPLETIHKFYESIPRRIEAVIAAKGGPTPY
ncbi:hypothetical protein FHG87_017748 [Trinorchestia longiramus]|nr:hypothetical protein FHG87_017748 [Trinorchestia longiramus]